MTVSEKSESLEGNNVDLILPSLLLYVYNLPILYT